MSTPDPLDAPPAAQPLPAPNPLAHPLADPAPPAPPATQAPHPPPAATRADVESLIEAAVQRITAALQARARTDTFQQDMITRLHNDLQEQVNRSAVLPVVTGMLRLHEEMEKVADHLRAGPGSPAPDLMLRQFVEFAEDLGSLIEQAGVVRFIDEAQGDQFNGSRQSLLGRDPTGDPALHQRISARVRPGADFGKTLLRREAVRVYAYDPALAAPAPQPASPPSNPSETAP